MERPFAEPWLVTLAALALLPLISAPVALAAGLAFALLSKGTVAHDAAAGSKRILQWAIVGLGFGVGGRVVELGATALWVAGGSVILVLVVSLAAARLLGVERKLGWLNASGAAVCGGSAIAAVGTAIHAPRRDLTVALGLVFALNAVAVVFFPLIGDAFGLGQAQFGVWAALAIHDTASVVAAAGDYGPQSLETATVWKLARAIWIAPLAFLAASRFKTGGRAGIPWFIGGFLAAAAIRFLAGDHVAFDALSTVSRRALVAAIFLVGASYAPGMMAGVQRRAVAQAVGVWILLAGVSLWAVLRWIPV